jgi:hypothetical protein
MILALGHGRWILHFKLGGNMAKIRKSLRLSVAAFAVALSLAFLVASARAQESTLASAPSATQIQGWPSHSHDAQHSGISSVAAQPLNKIHWSVPVDLEPPVGEILIHYGSPVITPANTVIVPVKTGNNSFRVEAHNGSTGALIWTLNTNYKAPVAGFTPPFSPVLQGNNLYIPEAGGVVLVRANPDQPTGAVSRLVFYGLNNYTANRAAFNDNVEINTPLTADSQGNIFFGFMVLGSTPIPLQSGLARISATGAGIWISATAASNDPNITKVNMACAPALSPNGQLVYVGVDNFDFGYGYLIAFNSTTLKALRVVRLKDPWSGMDATITDDSSAAPTVGPDGDIYYGVLENPFPSHNDRGWLLHFNASLSQVKTPGSFGWDDTASIVSSSLVSSYHGTSSYLVMTKYNNYAGVGTGNGVNKVAVLDPNATEPDPVIPSTKVMNEVLTVTGVTPDPDFPQFPDAVREWCINAAAVDPITKAILVNSEDGNLYRWDLTTNTLSQRIVLSTGIGEAYTPTEIGPDGTAYAINDAILDGVGQ